jgi:hypothetical protein
MTAMTTEHPMRQLAGRTLVTLRPLTVYVTDSKWAAVLGPALLLPGGTALEVDDGFLAAYARMAEDRSAGVKRAEDPQHLPVVPCMVTDPDLPAVRVAMNPDDVEQYCNVAPLGSGARVGKPATRCGHPARSLDDLVGRSCPGCFLRWWQATAAEKKPIDPEVVCL